MQHALHAGVELASIAAADRRTRDVIAQTPVLGSTTISEHLGARVVLKAEHLQRTGSFKLRGALNKVSVLGNRCKNGVIAASAGNHAQALAYAARSRGVSCEVFMPTDAPLSKVAACQAQGATVNLQGDTVDDCLSAAYERASELGAVFVHPFDDVDVICGQGVVGLELLDAVGDLAKVVVPVGGGGLASGVAVACKTKRPDITVVGVQAQACGAYRPSLEHGRAISVAGRQTIADGIAVKRPGEITLPLVSRWLDDIVYVNDDDIAEAMVFLLERTKQVVEGAGAAALTALLSGATEPSPNGSTAVILSGGNVDAALLASIIRRHETEVGRRLRLFTRLSDTAGSLASLLSLLAGTGANLLSVEHIREGVDLHVRESAVELVLGVRGPDHAQEAVEAVSRAGFKVDVLS
jgi:threonine dehydratase